MPPPPPLRTPARGWASPTFTQRSPYPLWYVSSLGSTVVAVPLRLNCSGSLGGTVTVRRQSAATHDPQIRKVVTLRILLASRVAHSSVKMEVWGKQVGLEGG